MTRIRTLLPLTLSLFGCLLLSPFENASAAPWSSLFPASEKDEGNGGRRLSSFGPEWPECDPRKDVSFYRSECLPLREKMGIQEAVELPQYGDRVINFECGGRWYKALFGFETCRSSSLPGGHEPNSRFFCGDCIAQSLPSYTLRSMSEALGETLTADDLMFWDSDALDLRFGGFICNYENESPYRAVCAFDLNRKETPDISGTFTYL